MTAVGLDLYGVQKNILTYLTTNFPMYSFNRGSILSDETLVRVNGDVQNYFVIRFGQLLVDNNGSAMGGPRWDDYYSTFDLNCVGATDDRAANSLNFIRDRLIGLRVQGSGALTLDHGASNYAILNTSGQPSAYFASQRFRFNMNTDSVASYIPIV
jgi:hypothetical protein